MLQVVILKGLPASGKSTYAKELVNGEGRKWLRVEKDLLRSMFHDSHYTRANEKFVLEARDNLIIQGLRAGKNIVVSDTNLAVKHEKRIRKIVKKNFGSNVLVRVDERFLKVPVEECVKRDLRRFDSVGKDVILSMYNKFLKVEPKQIEYSLEKEDIFLCDVDGTIALMSDRSPFDWSRVNEDKPNHKLIFILQKLIKHNRVVFMSGRDHCCKQHTIDWINNHIELEEPVEIYMRPTGDNRKDSIVKEELFRKYIEPNYNVITVWDDRDQVVRMWRNIGLTCFQVAEGIFNER